MLEQAELFKYLRKAKIGDEKAKEILLINNEPLLKSIIRKFKNKGVEDDDLYQLACIGFLKSINNFDEKFGVKFSTYTVPMVIGEIKRYMRDNGAIKVSRSLKILANKINKFISDYQSNNSHEPTIETIAAHFEINDDEVILALDSVKMPISLFEKNSDGDDKAIELIEKIPDSNTEDDMIEKIELSNLINSLNERERKIMFLRFFRDNTQSEVAKNLGVSQVQVSRLENKIIEKLRAKM